MTVTFTPAAAVSTGISRIPMLAAERSWAGLGDALGALHNHLNSGRFSTDATGAERDAAGFAAMAVTFAIESFTEATTRGPGTATAWNTLARLLAGEMASGRNADYREGLRMALELHQAAYAHHTAR